MPVIGFLNTASPGPYTARVGAFHQGLSETSYVEGRNVAIAYRWAEGQSERLPELAADLVAQRVSVITGANIAAALAAKAIATTIPIVFSNSGFRCQALRDHPCRAHCSLRGRGLPSA